MKEKMIKVLKVEPHKESEAVILENDLTALQEAVSIGAEYRGLIELVNLSEEACILCNEEGKLLNLEPNRRLGRDILCGVFYVTGQTEDGDLASLPETQMQHYMALFKEPEEIPESDVIESIIAKFFVC